MADRLYLIFPLACQYAAVDAWRLMSWLANGAVDWAFDADGVLLVHVESLQAYAGAGVHPRVLKHARPRRITITSSRQVTVPARQ